MSKPSDIPREVWEAALESARDWFGPDNGFYHECARRFAMTTMAERERCAKVIDNHRVDASFDDGTATGSAPFPHQGGVRPWGR